MSTILIGRSGGRAGALALSAALALLRCALAMPAGLCIGVARGVVSARMATVRRDILARMDAGLPARLGLDRTECLRRLDVPLWPAPPAGRF